MRRYAILILGNLVLCGCKSEDAGKGVPTAVASGSGAPLASGSSAAAPRKTAEEEAAEALAKYTAALPLSKPLSPKTGEFVAGPIKVGAELCTLSDGNPVSQSHMGVYSSVRVIGDHIAVIGGTEGVIKLYKIEKGAGCKLTLDTAVGDKGMLKPADHVKPSRLTSDEQGHLYASSGVFGTIRYKKDFTYDYKCAPRMSGYLVPHASGKWGYGHFVGSAMSKIDFDTTGCKGDTSFIDPQKKAGPFAMIHTVAFNGDAVLIGGSLSDGGKHVVVEFDKAGKEKFRIGNTTAAVSPEDGFGWVHAISMCKLGLCVLDSNYRSIGVWTADGKKHLTRVSLKEITGLDYGWYSDFVVSKAGTFILAGQTRAVKEVSEGLIYRLSGI